MKKISRIAAVAALFATASAWAVNTSQDTSAVLTITGSVTQQNSACAVSLTKSSITLSSDVSNIVTQGEDATFIEPVAVSITDESGNWSQPCQQAIDQNQLAIRFTGTADNSEGSVLANMASTDGAASGVGVGIFSQAKQPISVNTGVMKLMDSNNGGIFGLQLVKLKNQTVTTGKVSSVVTVEIVRL